MKTYDVTLLAQVQPLGKTCEVDIYSTRHASTSINASGAASECWNRASTMAFGDVGWYYEQDDEPVDELDVNLSTFVLSRTVKVTEHYFITVSG